MRAILHIDGDAFFAACEQALHPEWKGLPVVTGLERGIVSAASYEAKAKGVKRGVPLHQVRELCPDAVIVPSDYDAYMAYSRRMYAVVRRYTSVVEEYSIDEAFADLTGMDVPLRMMYGEIGRRIQEDIMRELDISVSVGIAPTKTLAKVGSKWKKPYGLFVIERKDIEAYLSKLPVSDVWGIGRRLTERLLALDVRTAWEFISLPQGKVTANFASPVLDTWTELRGEHVFGLHTEAKETQASIQKTRTFTPPSRNKEFVYAQLLKNFENACIKSRRYGLVARKASIFLKTQGFNYHGMEIAFARATAYPQEGVTQLRRAFERTYRPGALYRATGITLFDLVDSDTAQLSLFEASERPEQMRRVYEAVDAMAEKYGKHAVHLADSLGAMARVPERMRERENGRRKTLIYANARQADLARLATPRKALAIPMLAGTCN